MMLGVIALTGISVHSRTVNRAPTRATQVKRVIHGRANPELIPDSYAWRTFFSVLDHIYRDQGKDTYTSALQGYGISPAQFPERTYNAIAKELLDLATIVGRDTASLTNDIVATAERERKAGVTEDAIRQHGYDRSKGLVKYILEQREYLHRRIDEIDPTSAGLIWSRVLAAVSTVKAGMSLQEEYDDRLDGLVEYERELMLKSRERQR
jgi:hypothetical protein